MPTKLEMPDERDETGQGRRRDRRGQASSAPGGPERGPRLQGQAREHQEDRVLRGLLLLEECDRLVAAHDYCPGLRVLLAGADAQPRLAGLDDRVNHVLFAEGSRALIDGRRRARAEAVARAAWRGSAITPVCSIRSAAAYQQADRAGPQVSACIAAAAGSCASWSSSRRNTCS